MGRSKVVVFVVGVVVGVGLLQPLGAHFSKNTRHLGSHAWSQYIAQRVYTKAQVNARTYTQAQVRAQIDSQIDGRCSELGSILNTPAGLTCTGAFQTISTGAIHACGPRGTGVAECWGGGFNGRVGDADTSNHDVGEPSLVEGQRTFVAISAGSFHTCGIDIGGEAWCWGQGDHGALGDGSTFDHDVGVPTPVGGNHAFIDISSGYQHTCGVVEGGAAYCWGIGDDGRLGDGNTGVHDVGTPVAVGGGHTFTAISAGFAHTCGIETSGAMRCWGNGDFGQLGDANTTPHETGTPTLVGGSHTFATLTAAGNRTCGLDTAGTAYCWGYGLDGRLGDGNTADHETGTPVLVGGGHTFATISGGSSHTCGVDTAGAGWCWGNGDFGQLGDANTTPHETGTPTLVGGGHTFAYISGGIAYTCGVDTDGGGWCWGAGNDGRLGDGDTSAHNVGTPTAVML